MRNLKTVCLLAALCLLYWTPVSARPVHTPGPYSVKSQEYPNLLDPERERKVPMKLFWGERAPKGHLIVVSHGAGGNWDSLFALASHLASHGYVVICPEHIQSNTKSFKKASRELGFRGALKSLTRNPEANLQRPRDVSFCIDQAANWNRSHSRLRGKILTDRVGMMGHSFGAYTTLVVCGARPLLDYLPNSGTGLAHDLSDPRVTFGLALSPQAPGEPFFSEESYRTIKRPLIGISGTRDRQQGATRRGVGARKRKEAFKLWPTGDKVFVWLENADHMAFSDDTGSGKRRRRQGRHNGSRSQTREETTKIVKAIALQASDVHLRQNREARKSFRGSSFKSLVGDRITSLRWFRK